MAASRTLPKKNSNLFTPVQHAVTRKHAHARHTTARQTLKRPASPMVKSNAAGRKEISRSFHEEDRLALVSPTRLPRLDNSHEFVDVPATKKHKSAHQGDVLKQCMVLSFESAVYSAQRAAALPGPQDLADLPLFQQAREADIVFMKECHARRKELQMEEERRRQEEARLEAERRLERQKEREEQRKKRTEAKELRRQERMEAKRERMGAVQERKMRAYEEAYEKWERNFKEQKSTLDEAQEKIKKYASMKLEREGSLRDFHTEKEELLASLRSAAVRADSLPVGAAKEKAEKEAKEKEAKEKETKEKEREREREREKKRERDSYKYTRAAGDITIIAKPQGERERSLEARSPSFRDRERDRARDRGERERERDQFGGYGGMPGGSSFPRGGTSIRDSREAWAAGGGGGGGGGSGHSIRRGPPPSARYGGGGSIRDTRDPRDGPGGPFSKYGGGRGGRGGGPYRGGRGR